jgi:hypothetical protein
MTLINEARILVSKLDFTLVHIFKLAIGRNNSINCEWLHVECNKIIVVKNFQDVILTIIKRNETKGIARWTWQDERKINDCVCIKKHQSTEEGFINKSIVQSV